MKKIFLLALLTFTFSAGADDLKKISCRLGNPPSQNFTIIESTPIGSTKLYSIKTSKSIDSPIYSDQESTPEEAIQLSRGSDVIVSCLGHPEQILLISGEFSSNFLQGVIFRYDSNLKSLQRLDISERSPASRVYLGRNYFSAVVPSDYRETPKKYLVYRYSTQKEIRETPKASDRLPGKENRQVIIIPQRPKP